MTAWPDGWAKFRRAQDRLQPTHGTIIQPFTNPSVTMSKTTIEIDLMDFAECLARLASLKLYMQHHDMPSIGVDRAVWRLTETNSEADAAWKKAQADALHHHTVIVPKLAALREEFAGKRLVQDHIHVQP